MGGFLTLENADVAGKNVFLRLDLNMPVDDEGNVTDTSRLDASMQTLLALKEKGAKTLIVTHRGRPQKREEALSTKILLPLLEEKLHQKVKFSETLEHAQEMLQTLEEGQFVLLENIRFWKGEEENESDFSADLASLCSIYVNDAFSVSHRKHASVYGVPKRMEVRIAGYNLLTEVTYLKQFCEKGWGEAPNAKTYTLSLLGGAKVSTKMKLLESLLKLSTLIIPGGGMANTFLVAAGLLKPGASFYEKDFLEEAGAFLRKNPLKFMLPIDAIVVDDLDHPTLTMTLDIVNVPPKLKIVDIGPKTRQMIEDKVSLASTIVWNGPFGVFEKKPFDEGSASIVHSLSKRTKEGATTLVGGGDTLACLGDDKKNLSFVSTAGGPF